MGKLTAVAVKAATKPGRYQDGQSLQLFVKNSGAQFWVLRIQAGGKRRDVGLGSAATVSLKDARDKADELRKLYKRGADPLADRRAAKLANDTIPTFRDAAAIAIAHSEHKGGAGATSSIVPIGYRVLNDMPSQPSAIRALT